jgi:hypothetical protein
VKKFAIFVLVMSVFTSAYSQESNDPEKLKLINEALIKELKASKDSIKLLRDSVSKPALLPANKRNENVEPDKTDSNKQKKKSDKDIIKDLKASIQKNTVLINLLTDSIKKKDSLIINIKNESTRREQKKFDEGLQKVYDKIRQTYQNNTFDYLIKHSTKQSIELDSQLVITNDEAVKKWKALQIYFSAQQVIREKYDEQKLNNAQKQLNSITLTAESLDELKKKLPKYKLYSDSLKTTIASIINYDKNNVANDDNIQKAKQQQILLKLSYYFFNYRFNFTDYPYLADIVLEIMKLKQKDANSDISHLSSKL